MQTSSSIDQSSIMCDYCGKYLNKEYYFKSKHHYLEREKTYKNFVTIVRQICKYHAIPYTSKILYSKSTYEIKYFIYHN